MVHPEQVAENTQSAEAWTGRFANELHNRWDHLTNEGTGEEGYMGLGIPKFMLRPMVVVGIGVGAVIGASSAWGQHMEYTGVHGNADLEKAHTSSNAKILVFKEDKQIDVATAYFKETFTATKIPYSIDWYPAVGPITSPVDVIPDFQINKEINGVGEEKFLVPFNALSAKLDSATGKTDITVDKSKVVVSSSWVEAPVPRDFVMSGTNRVYDANSTGANLVKNISENFSHFNVDTFNNTVNDLNKLVARAMSLKALSVVTQQCPAKLDTKLEAAVKQAVIANVQSSGQDPSKLGKFTFTDGAFVWAEEKIPEVVQSTVDATYKHDRSITVSNNFAVDELKCDVSGPAGN